MQLICPSGSCVSWATEGIMHRQVAFGMSVRTRSCMTQWRWRWRAKSGGGSRGCPANIFGALSVHNIASSAERKPPICTADELHYVSVPGTEWQLALWRYVPSPGATSRNHPLLLLSGVGTNAIGYDLSPGYSFARHMSGEGFDTWILEVRGAGLSKRQGPSDSESNLFNGAMQDLVATSVGTTDGSLTTDKQSTPEASDSDTKSSNLDINKSNSGWDESELVSKLSDIFMRLAERLSGFLSEGQSQIVSAKLFDQISKFLEDAQLLDRFNEVRGKISGLLEARQSSAMAGQIRVLSQRLVNIIEEGQKSMSPQFYDLQERLANTIEDFQKQLDLIVKYDWDFDDYLKEDVPAAMRYILAETKPKDGKLLAIGHSMGGILLYSMLSHHGFEGSKAALAAVVTLASSLDYTSSNSSLKLLLPLVWPHISLGHGRIAAYTRFLEMLNRDPAEALNVPVVPLGALLATAYPLCTRPPYVLSWLNPQISAGDMMHPELFEKLVLNNFCTIPAKVILQLTTAFRSGGLRDRSGNFFYQKHLYKCDTPVLALAGDEDLICPPVAVYETIKFIPPHMVTYKVFGGKDGNHYAHYDLVGGRLAKSEVYPCIIEFLARHDVADP